MFCLSFVVLAVENSLATNHKREGEVRVDSLLIFRLLLLSVCVLGLFDLRIKYDKVNSSILQSTEGVSKQSANRVN